MLDLPHLADLLDRHQPFDALEETNRTRFHAFLEKVDVSTGRSSDGRLTAAGWIIDPVAQKILLIYETKYRLWLNPGGKYESTDGTIDATMCREVYQETGIIADNQSILFDIGVIDPSYNPALSCTFYDIRYLVHADSKLPLNPPEQGILLKWFSYAETLDQMPDDLQNHRMLAKTKSIFS